MDRESELAKVMAADAFDHGARDAVDYILHKSIPLPVSADGDTLHVGDEVWIEGRSESTNVLRLTYDSRFNTPWRVAVSTSVIVITDFKPCELHTRRPDSLERIADELDGWRLAASCDCRIKAMDEEIVHDLAERIRKLAKDGECE